MTLMTERENAARPIAQTGILTRPDGTPVRVLVVDDEPNLAEVLSSVLRHEGWDVATAGTGINAVRTGRVPAGRGRSRHDAAGLRRP
jgi:PleD family two-component response regulator